MPGDPLVAVIAAARCERVALKHPECVAAAVRAWIGREIADELREWKDGYDTTTVPTDDAAPRYEGAGTALRDLRRRLGVDSPPPGGGGAHRPVFRDC